MRERPSAGGIGGNGEARRTMASAAWSSIPAPLDRASAAEITAPLAESEKRTVAIPRIPALFAAAG